MSLSTYLIVCENILKHITTVMAYVFSTTFASELRSDEIIRFCSFLKCLLILILKFECNKLWMKNVFAICENEKYIFENQKFGVTEKFHRV